MALASIAERGVVAGSWYQAGISSRLPPRRGSHPPVYSGEPLRSGYVLIQRDHLANVTSLEHERWKREHPEFRRRIGIR